MSVLAVNISLETQKNLGQSTSIWMQYKSTVNYYLHFNKDLITGKKLCTGKDLIQVKSHVLFKLVWLMGNLGKLECFRLVVQFRGDGSGIRATEDQSYH